MRVFNLTPKPLDYRGVQLAANGGSHDFRDMAFVPNRDRALVEKKILSFGNLPQWFLDERALRAFHTQKAMEAAIAPKHVRQAILPTEAPAREATEEAEPNFKKKK